MRNSMNDFLEEFISKFLDDTDNQHDIITKQLNEAYKLDTELPKNKVSLNESYNESVNEDISIKDINNLSGMDDADIQDLLDSAKQVAFSEDIEYGDADQDFPIWNENGGEYEFIHDAESLREIGFIVNEDDLVFIPKGTVIDGYDPHYGEISITLPSGKSIDLMFSFDQFYGDAPVTVTESVCEDSNEEQEQNDTEIAYTNDESELVDKENEQEYEDSYTDDDDSLNDLQKALKDLLLNSKGN